MVIFEFTIIFPSWYLNFSIMKTVQNIVLVALSSSKMHWSLLSHCWSGTWANLNHLGIVRSTTSTFMVEPMEPRFPLHGAIVAQYILRNSQSVIRSLERMAALRGKQVSEIITLKRVSKKSDVYLTAFPVFLRKYFQCQ